MSYCTTSSSDRSSKKYKGVRQRKWGKWVSEIRVPGSQERLWLGTYATPEAAAVAHDVAFYCLRRPASLEVLNFPEMLPSCCVQQRQMSPRSVQTAASDAGMAVDAQSITAAGKDRTEVEDGFLRWDESNREEEALSISVSDYIQDFEHY